MSIKPTAIDVAQYLIDTHGAMTNLKLQKILYFVQAWNLTWNGDPAFQGEIQAWQMGPASPELYEAAKHYGKEPVRVLSSANPELVDEDLRAVIAAIMEHYGEMTAGQLVELTHEDSAWVAARDGLPEEMPSDLAITENAMRSWHSLQVAEKKSSPVKPVENLRKISDEEFFNTLDAAAQRWKGTLQRLADR